MITTLFRAGNELLVWAKNAGLKIGPHTVIYLSPDLAMVYEQFSRKLNEVSTWIEPIIVILYYLCLKNSIEVTPGATIPAWN
ncbi:MAG: hypothetical protein NVS3B29_05360 [Candidatus Saccharimonadales bacterium]